MLTFRNRKVFIKFVEHYEKQERVDEVIANGLLTFDMFGEVSVQENEFTQTPILIPPVPNHREEINN